MVKLTGSLQGLFFAQARKTAKGWLIRSAREILFENSYGKMEGNININF